MTLIPSPIIFANKHWRHIIGQYGSNRAALVDQMSNSRGNRSFPIPFL